MFSAGRFDPSLSQEEYRSRLLNGPRIRMPSLPPRDDVAPVMHTARKAKRRSLPSTPPAEDDSIQQKPTLGDMLIVPAFWFVVGGLMYYFMLRKIGLDGLAQVILRAEGRSPTPQ